MPKVKVVGGLLTPGLQMAVVPYFSNIVREGWGEDVEQEVVEKGKDLLPRLRRMWKLPLKKGSLHV